MGFWDVAAPVFSAGANLLGPILSYDAQREANSTNKLLARETNALHQKLFNQQIGENWKMFNAANEWNSPAQQRQRLEQAGYNPAALFQNNGALMSSSIQAPSAPPLATAQVQPAVALGNGISSVVGSGLSALTAMAEARKSNAEATAQEINNVTLGRINIENARAAGYDADIKSYDAALKEQTYDDQVDLAHQNALVRNAEYKDLVASAAFKEAQRKVAMSQVDLNATEKARLVEATALLIQQQKTEISQQEMLKALNVKYMNEAKLAQVTAWYNEYVAPSVVESNRAQASYYREQSAGLQIENEVKRKYANAEKVISLAREISQMDVNKATIKELQAAARHHGVQADQGQLQILQSALKASTGLGMVTTMYGDLWPLMYMGNMLK